MPLLLDRRRFLQASAAFATFGLRGVGETTSARVALLSDTHIAANRQDRYRGFSPHENLKKVCGEVDQFRPDLLVINGDLARKSGETEDYAALCEYVDPLAERVPTVVSMGNHDDRTNARKALAKRAGDLQPVEKKLVSAIDAGPAQFVLLDSLLVTNIAQGQVGHKQREWLRSYLDGQTSKPTIVFVHHNPDMEDDNALVDAPALLDILKPNRRVKALIFGHTHVYEVRQVDGLQLVNLPAVGYNFKDGVPVGWVEAEFRSDGAALRLRTVAGEQKNNGQELTLPWR